MTSDRLEKIGLYLSVGSALFMSILGISFGIAIASDAILLDGFFNVVTFLMAIVTLWIAWLQKQPENDQFHFGYLSFVPLVNLVKSLLVLVLSLFALFSAISTLLHGGRDLNASIAVIYAIIAATGCLITALIQRKLEQKTQSVMLHVDGKNWMINGLISLSVGIAFSLVNLIKNTNFAWFVPYADSTIVALIVCITLPVPMQLIGKNLHQLLLGAPKKEIQDRIRNIFTVAAEDFVYQKYWLRITQVGNTVFVSIYWLLPQDYLLKNIQELDRVREKIAGALNQEFHDLIVDVIFTQDEKWGENISAN